MKHIKIFEDYSDEEIDSLRDDLYGIGADERFELGKDFGLGPGLDQTINGGNFPAISIKLFEYLLKKGKIKSTGGGTFTFTDDNEFNIPDGLHSKIVKTAGFDGIRVIQILKGEYDYLRPDQYIPIFTKVIEALGKIRT